MQVALSDLKLRFNNITCFNLNPDNFIIIYHTTMIHVFDSSNVCICKITRKNHLQKKNIEFSSKKNII